MKFPLILVFQSPLGLNSVSKKEDRQCIVQNCSFCSKDKDFKLVMVGYWNAKDTFLVLDSTKEGPIGLYPVVLASWSARFSLEKGVPKDDAEEKKFREVSGSILQVFYVRKNW